MDRLRTNGTVLFSSVVTLVLFVSFSPSSLFLPPLCEIVSSSESFGRETRFPKTRSRLPREVKKARVSRERVFGRRERQQKPDREMGKS